jgi:hypothetical protein
VLTTIYFGVNPVWVAVVILNDCKCFEIGDYLTANDAAKGEGKGRDSKGQRMLGQQKMVQSIKAMAIG